MATNTPKLGLVNPEKGKGEKYNLNLWTENNNKIDQFAEEASAQLADKANKTQPPWITPTLLNGATGTLQYRKNEFGRIEFKGSITHPNAATVHFMTMPAGYKMFEKSRLPLISEDNTLGNLTVLSSESNNLMFISTSLANKKVSLNNVTYEGV